MYLYVEKDSFFHKVHPVTKIILLLFFFYFAIVFNSPLYLGSGILLVILITIYSGGMKNIYIMRFILVLLFIFSATLWAFFIKTGNVIFKLYHLTITDKSLIYGIGMGMRLNLMVLAGIFFFSITMVEEFSFGLHKLGLPYPFCFTLSMAFRLVPIFLNTGIMVAEAQTLRGLDLRTGNIFRKISKHIPLIIPIFIIAIKSVNNLCLALETKGFIPEKKRTFYLERSLKSFDYLIIVSLILVALSALILRIKGFGVVLNRL